MQSGLAYSNGAHACMYITGAYIHRYRGVYACRIKGVIFSGVAYIIYAYASIGYTPSLRARLISKTYQPAFFHLGECATYQPAIDWPIQINSHSTNINKLCTLINMYMNLYIGICKPQNSQKGGFFRTTRTPWLRPSRKTMQAYAIIGQL